MKMRSLLCLSLAGLLWAVSGAAQEEPPKPEVGLKIGTRAPMFKLKDQNGKEVSLENLLKKGPVAVVFYRSASWCMFCKFEIIHLQENIKKFEAAGDQVIGISYDAVPAVKKFADSKSITFPLLSDAGSKTIDAYGVRDSTSPGPQEPFATHATFVLDQNGIIRAKILDVLYQEQPGVNYLLKALKDARNSSDDDAAHKKMMSPDHQASRTEPNNANPETPSHEQAPL